MIKVKILQDVKWRKPGRTKEIFSHKSGEITSVPKALAESWLKVKKAELVQDKKKLKKKTKNKGSI